MTPSAEPPATLRRPEPDLPGQLADREPGASLAPPPGAAPPRDAPALGVPQPEPKPARPGRELPAGPPAAALAVVAALLSLAALAGLAAHAANRRQADRADPIASLAAPVVSRTWDLAFWSTHQVARTPLWHTALAYCLDRGEAAFPSCTAVRLASWWRPAATSAATAAPAARTASAAQAAPAAPAAPTVPAAPAALAAPAAPETRP